MEFLPNEISIFIRIFHVLGLSHMERTDNVSLKLYLFHKIYNIAVLYLVISYAIAMIFESIMNLRDALDLFSLVENSLKLQFSVQVVIAMLVLYRLSRTGQLQLQHNGKFKSLTRMPCKMKLLQAMVLIPLILPLVYNSFVMSYGLHNLSAFCSEMTLSRSETFLNNSNVTHILNLNASVAATDFASVRNILRCAMTVFVFVQVNIDVVLITIPAYLFFRTYIISHEIITFHNRLKTNLKKLQIENLAVLRMQFGKVFLKTSKFNETHKYIIASSVVTAVTSTISFGYLLVKAEVKSYDSTWIFFYLPEIILNYGLMLYGPAILRDTVS